MVSSLVDARSIGFSSHPRRLEVDEMDSDVVAPEQLGVDHHSDISRERTESISLVWLSIYTQISGIHGGWKRRRDVSRRICGREGVRSGVWLL